MSDSLSNVPHQAISAIPQQAIDDRVTRRTTPVRNRLQQRRRERIQVVVMCVVMLMALGLGISLATKSGLQTAFRSMGLSGKDAVKSGSKSRNPSDGVGSGGGDGAGGDSTKFGQPQLRSGTIVPTNLRDPCNQLKFDNDTGAVSESAKPCKSEVAIGPNGAPVPQGTINRMNAISKAFSN